MALREIRKIGDEILLKRSKEVKKLTPRIVELIEDMFDTMHEAGGIGIAAPQVGVLKRIAIIDAIPEATEEDLSEEATEEDISEEEKDVKGDGEGDISDDVNAGGCGDCKDVLDTDDAEDENLGEPLVLINPVIIKSEGDHADEEGCLSVPGKRGKVTRPNKITVKAFDENMEEYELECEGLLARAICHEIDHLNGVLYVDLVEDGLHDIEEDSKESPDE